MSSTPMTPTAPPTRTSPRTSPVTSEPPTALASRVPSSPRDISSAHTSWLDAALGPIPIEIPEEQPASDTLATQAPTVPAPAQPASDTPQVVFAGPPIRELTIAPPQAPLTMSMPSPPAHTSVNTTVQCNPKEKISVRPKKASSHTQRNKNKP